MPNPFNPNPLKDKTREIIGRDKELEDSLYFATSNSMFFIKGEKGVGKTFIIRKIIEELRKDYKIIYLDGKEFSKNKNIEKVLLNSKKIYEKIFRKKGLILIIDDVDNLTNRNLERIKYYYDKDYVSTVLFTASKLPSNKSIISRIGNRIITLEKLSSKQAYDIYLSRAEEDFSSLDVENLYDKSKNLKEFITELHVMYSQSPELAYMEEEIEKNTSEECDVCGLKLENLGNEWRCRRCDTYCTLCGELVVEEDNECPRCFAIFG